MNKGEKRLYSKMGLLVIISLVILITTAALDKDGLLISDSMDSCQQFTCSGIAVKDNLPEFKRFLEGIKKNNGVLILGTSETNAFIGLNYQSLLNRYYDTGLKFSYLAGAGRLGNVYFPVLVNNKDLFQHMKILYFVNPVYWSKTLNEFNFVYFDRYNSLDKTINAKSELSELGIYNEFVSPYVNNSLWSKDHKYVHALAKVTEGYLGGFRNYFISAYNYVSVKLFEDENKTLTNACLNDEKIQSIDSAQIVQLKEKIQLDKNVSHEFSLKDDSVFLEISRDMNFQMNLLRGFNTLCKEYQVEVTYFLGPFNQIYCEKFSPEYTDLYLESIEEIKQFFGHEKLNYIDGSELSVLPGTFNDKMHHSEYAAWLIAEKIAANYE